MEPSHQCCNGPRTRKTPARALEAAKGITEGTTEAPGIVRSSLVHSSWYGPVNHPAYSPFGAFPRGACERETAYHDILTCYSFLPNGLLITIETFRRVLHGSAGNPVGDIHTARICLVKRSVLVVDDEEDIRELVGHRLLKEGYQVASVASGEQASR